jgi:hypothetical protein
MTLFARAAPLLVIAVAGLGGCTRRATTAECNALLDRYVELLVRQENPDAREIDIAKAKDLARARVARDKDFSHCTRDVSKRDVSCALAAPNVDELEKCME